MKKIVWILAVVLCFAGCADMTEPVMETVADGIVEPVAAEPSAVSVWVPENAAVQTMAGEGECYTWGENELRVQTFEGGDIRSTLLAVTGMDPERLTVMEYERDGVQLYQTVWSATSEEGITLGRCMVADDGNYHYCISLLSPEGADAAGDFARICASMTIGEQEPVK